MKTVFKELNIYVNEEDITRIMNQFDENGNECIEFEEFIKVLSKNIESNAQEAWIF
jgi:Ca2+-binding EF-hand superfamily protein